MEIEPIPDIAPPLLAAICGGISRVEINYILCKTEFLFTYFDSH